MNNDSLDFIFRPSGDITQEVTVARMESLRKAAARAQPPRKVIGGKIRTTPDGWALEINQQAVSVSHPWKVTANADATVNVAAGKVLGFVNQAVASAGDYPTYIHLKKLLDYEGTGDTPITISGTGKIYGSIPFTDGNPISQVDVDFDSVDDFSSGALIPDTSQSLTVTFGESLPTTGEVFVFEIADVSLNEDNIAQIDDQVLTHNPQLAAWNAYGPGSP